MSRRTRKLAVTLVRRIDQAYTLSRSQLAAIIGLI
jgi:hypothetical protein